MCFGSSSWHKSPRRGGWWRRGHFVLLLARHRRPFTSPFSSEMAAENPVVLAWLRSTVPSSLVPLKDSAPGLHPRRGTPRTHPRGLQHTPASPPQLGASPLRLWDLPRSSSRGAAQRRGRLARPLKRQQILLSAHSSRSVKSQSVHQQLSVVCRLQPRAASAPVRAGWVSRSPWMRPSRSQPTDKPGGDTVPLNAA